MPSLPVRTIVECVRKMPATEDCDYLVICKRLDSPRKVCCCRVPKGIDPPHAGDYLTIWQGGKTGKQWIFWA
jgi:hypothetical protein